MSKFLRTKRPSVSVVIPTLDRSALLERAINSVLAQSLPVDEIIVVDNGSNDGTLNMLSNFFPTVRVIFERKRGVSSARNKGIKASTGDWVALLDSDDEWLPEKLEKQFDTYFRHKKELRFIHTNEVWLKNNIRISQLKKHKKKGGDVFNECLLFCCISPSSVLIRRDLFLEIGYFDEVMPACEDYDLWLRMCLQNEILFLDEELIIKHGGHSDQLSKKYWGMDRFRIYALEKLVNNPSLSLKRRGEVFEAIIKKSEILIKGGLKRENLELVNFYSRKKRHFLDRSVEEMSFDEEPKIYE